MGTRVAVIGAGPGGYAAAFHAADLGMQVTLIDAEPNPGGVCTFKGCIPSKALLHAAKVLDEAKHADAFGVTFGKPSIDVDKLRSWKDGVVKKQTGGLGLLAKARKVDFVQGRASIVDGKTLSVETGKGERRIETDYIIIATGSRPSTVPNVSIDSPKVLDSTTALELPDVPESAARRGRRIHRSGTGNGLRRAGLEGDRCRNDRRAAARRRSRSRGGRRQADGHHVRGDPAGNEGHRREGREERAQRDVRRQERRRKAPQIFDRVLVAVGRRPNSAIAGLDKTKVQVNQRGFIEVDGQRRTAEPSIFAIGDVVGDPMLAHKASHEARVAVEAIHGQPDGVRAARNPRSRLYRPRAGMDGPDRNRGEEAEPHGRDCEVSHGPPPAARRRSIGPMA